MNVLIVLLLASLSVAVAFLAAFIWAVRSGQYEDTMTPSMRILSDDDVERNLETTRQGTEERGIKPA